jgi:acyl transferase domain-containing protein/phosphopantetheinyl transferase
MTSYQPSESNRPVHGRTTVGIAVIGMSCLFPGARNVDAFWQNILGKVDSVTDPPPEAWDSDVYYDPTFADTDKVYCRRGGYLGSLVSFDPLAHGIPPVAVGGEPDQWLALQLAHDAMADAGCLQLPEDVRRRTEVILGKGTYLNGGNAIAVEHGLVIGQTIEIIRKLNPDFSEEQIERLRDEMKRVLPPMNAETVPGLIPNIIVGRIANRMDLMGPAYTVDAACASSLVAVQHAMRDLTNGDCDLALVGGAQVWMPVPTLNVFCQLGALSKRQQIRPFDQDADGTLLGEGIGMVVLKRLEDAERDGDRIYSVIRGAGVSSDGRGVSVMAPRIDGEELALRRAYDSSGISPDTIDLIEAHGTATPVGDVVEIQALTRVFGERNGTLPHCAIGTVKSMISHTIPASGVAGLIKTSLALHHKILPPTINCDTPNPKLELEKTPFYVNTEARPWIDDGLEPRRAGINSFGFGGINAHLIVEEYRPSFDRVGGITNGHLRAHLPPWETEVFILEGQSHDEIVREIDRLASYLDRSIDQDGQPPYSLADLASSVNARLGRIAEPLRLAIVASNGGDLSKKLSRARQKLVDTKASRIKEVSGIYFFAEPLGRQGKIAVMFPGEGSQYTNMLADLCLHFPEVRECFDRSDRIFRQHQRGIVLSDILFPRPAFNDADRRAAEQRLMQMDMAIEAVLTANDAVLTLIKGLKLNADVLVGHSTGEYSAMAASGMLDLETEEKIAEFSLALNRSYPSQSDNDGVPRAMMLAIGTDRDTAAAIAGEAGGDVFLAMDNCPHQAVLVGERSAVERAREITIREQLIFEELTFDRAYHTSLFTPYAENLRSVFEPMDINQPHTPVYSCTTADKYPTDPDQVRNLIVDHWSSPVEFQRTIESLYDSGVRLFVEAGPRGNLSAFVEDILRGRDFSAIPANVMRRAGITQLNHLVALLSAQGVDLDWSYLYRHRPIRSIDLETTDLVPQKPAAGRQIGLSTTWPMLTISEQTANELNAERQRFAPRPNSTAERVADLSVPAMPPRESHVPDGVQTSGDNEQTGFEFSAPEPSAAPAPSLAEDSSALYSYFSTMQDFLATQQDVMRAFITRSSMAEERVDELEMGRWRSGDDVQVMDTNESGNRTCRSRHPMLDYVVVTEPDTELIARREIRRDVDLYLDDHTLGHALSGSRREALALMPLTLSLEMLAEAAAELVPNRRVVGLRDVQANRWIAVADEPIELEITATRLASRTDVDIVRVSITNLSESDVEQNSGTPSLEAIVELAREYASPLKPIEPSPGRPSSRSTHDLYGSVMFHGPTWQGVQSVDVVGEGGSEATLSVLPTDRFFADQHDVQFLIDPITLDAAGQVVGFWTSEMLEAGKIVFPFRLDHLDIFGDRPKVGSVLKCRASIALVGAQLTSSTIDVLDEVGQVWMRLTGWQDKRFDLPEQFETLMLPEGLAAISSDWQDPVAPYADSGAIECFRVDARINSDRQFWARIWSQAVLSPEERDEFLALRTPEPRQLEWLAARTSAKDAVRSLVSRHFGIELLPSDVVIYHDELGAPHVWCEALSESAVLPVISLTHTDGISAAIAGLVSVADGGPTAGVGIDIELVKPLPSGFVDTAFDESERAVLASLTKANDDSWILRAWCAKEAIAKATGLGLVDGPRSIQIEAVDPQCGAVVARSGARFGNLSNRTFVAHTGRDGDVVFATATCALT